METQTRGTVLVVGAVALLVLTLGVSAATAPDASVEGKSGERRTLVGIQGGGAGWHKYGSVAAVEGNNVTWRASDADSYFDVTKLDNGSVLAAFMDGGYEDCGPYDSPCTHTGFRVIDPSGGEPTVEYEFSFPVAKETNSEVHDVEYLGDGRFVMTDMTEERIMVVEGQEVVWEWRASSFYEAPEDPTARDWLHINDVDVIAEGTYLVSVRNANQLVVVKRGQGVVEVVNADAAGDDEDGSCLGNGQLLDADGDGDVRCGDPETLDHQHNPQWLGGDPGGDGEAAVLVADSDNDRVVELHREDGEWTAAWTLSRAGGIDLWWPRDADRLENGNTLITDTLHKRIVEVNENGTVVWSMRTERIPYEADRVPQGELTRAEWYGSSGQSPTERGGGIPLLSRAAPLLRGVFPWLPFWYGSVQLGVTVFALVASLVGARDLYRARGRQPDRSPLGDRP